MESKAMQGWGHGLGKASQHYSHLQTQMKVPLHVLTIHKHTTQFTSSFSRGGGGWRRCTSSWMRVHSNEEMRCQVFTSCIPFSVPSPPPLTTTTASTGRLVLLVPHNSNQSCISRILQKVLTTRARFSGPTKLIKLRLITPELLFINPV